jgi:hypothetical protein
MSSPRRLERPYVDSNELTFFLNEPTNPKSVEDRNAMTSGSKKQLTSLDQPEALTDRELRAL